MDAATEGYRLASTNDFSELLNGNLPSLAPSRIDPLGFSAQSRAKMGLSWFCPQLPPRYLKSRSPEYSSKSCIFRATSVTIGP
jgi:hypothetical protein